MSSLIATLVFNTLIAGFLTALGFGGGFAVNLVFSQCAGLSILALIQMVLRLPLDGAARGAGVAAAVVAGALVGGALGRLLTGLGASPDGSHETQALLIGLLFGSIAAGFFWLRQRNAQLESDLQARELARLEAEKQSLAAQLRMLQAQIEPHFLFNSLANVAALIDTDRKLAGSLLEALIRYLRSSLARTRAEGGTLGDEVALLTAYLEVLKVRMGNRLDYRFDIVPELLAAAFPPMLLQPLVENAIRHGLEPKVAGGRITVSAQKQGERLRIAVADDGLGFGETPGDGIGVRNVRDRLAALYGPAARLELSSGVGAGATATMSIPLGVPA
ncbi:sensor histidine kinase [Sulfuritalea hydrogenivorans]|uniref:histidine kinase n=1 Tax=Sulfuritalea hydrogenivorans sk43H TaxID=1223802 RepID=W0SG40_9PROT|nr:sensor histidine kinase [Sulfuritalea hydrogenivorans]BAO30249.1 signal transduction histidine kinase [Sulfuritalea hydrogenivorans sk43H]